LFSKVYLFFFSIKSYTPRKNATYFAIRDTYNYLKFARHPKGWIAGARVHGAYNQHRPRKLPTEVNHKIKVNKPKVVKPQTDANKIIKNTKKSTTDTKCRHCRAFYKFRKRPTTKWALALSAKCPKGIIPIKGPYNAFGERIRFGTQPCGCRLSRGMTNRSVYFLHPNK
jgi:hypothetical protein